MKALILFFCLLLSVRYVSAQPGLESIQKKLSSLTDQFDKSYKIRTDRLILIYVPGMDDPFTKVYDKWKSKQWKEADVQVVGGFREMLSAGGHGGASANGMKSHIQEAMIARYGKDHFPILLDMQSEIGSTLELKGFSIVIFDKNRMEKKEDFGSDRKKFFDAIQTYFK